MRTLSILTLLLFGPPWLAHPEGQDGLALGVIGSVLLLVAGLMRWRSRRS